MIYLGTCEFMYITNYFFENNKIYSQSHICIRYITYEEISDFENPFATKWAVVPDKDVKYMTQKMIVDDKKHYKTDDIPLHKYLVNRIHYLMFDKI